VQAKTYGGLRHQGSFVWRIRTPDSGVSTPYSRKRGQGVAAVSRQRRGCVGTCQA
ncbi:hypothetical protein FOZ62_030542, partial [Perkinsus olseni]